MHVPAVAAVFALLASVGLAYALQRRRQDRGAFASLLAAPLAAALTFAAVGALPRRATAPPAAEPAPVASRTADDVMPAPAPAEAAAPRTAATTPATAGGSVFETLRHQAEEFRRNRRFSEARDVYARITKSAPFDADAWADLGDASAAAAGGDLKAGTQAIDRALELDPNHAKALWLKASYELQERRYGKALELWQRLLARLPGDSNDARIVSANVEETRALAAAQGAGR